MSKKLRNRTKKVKREVQGMKRILQASLLAACMLVIMLPVGLSADGVPTSVITDIHVETLFNEYGIQIGSTSTQTTETTTKDQETGLLTTTISTSITTSEYINGQLRPVERSTTSTATDADGNVTYTMNYTDKYTYEDGYLSEVSGEGSFESFEYGYANAGGSGLTAGSIATALGIDATAAGAVFDNLKSMGLVDENGIIAQGAELTLDNVYQAIDSAGVWTNESNQEKSQEAQAVLSLLENQKDSGNLVMTSKTEGEIDRVFEVRDGQALLTSQTQEGKIFDKTGTNQIGTSLSTSTNEYAQYAGGNWVLTQTTSNTVSDRPGQDTTEMTKVTKYTYDENGTMTGMSRTATGSRTVITGAKDGSTAKQTYSLQNYESPAAFSDTEGWYFKKESYDWHHEGGEQLTPPDDPTDPVDPIDPIDPIDGSGNINQEDFNEFKDTIINGNGPDASYEAEIWTNALGAIEDELGRPLTDSEKDQIVMDVYVAIVTGQVDHDSAPVALDVGGVQVKLDIRTSARASQSGADADDVSPTLTVGGKEFQLTCYYDYKKDDLPFGGHSVDLNSANPDYRFAWAAASNFNRASPTVTGNVLDNGQFAVNVWTGVGDPDNIHVDAEWYNNQATAEEKADINAGLAESGGELVLESSPIVISLDISNPTLTDAELNAIIVGEELTIHGTTVDGLIGNDYELQVLGLGTWAYEPYHPFDTIA